jgi:hypothetical protein
VFFRLSPENVTGSNLWFQSLVGGHFQTGES